MLEIRVEAISQTKKGIKPQGQGWINADRSLGGVFKDIVVGDTLTNVEISDDGKWVKSYQVKRPEAAQSSGASAPSMNPSDRDSKITRGNAVNAAFAAVYTAAMADKKSHEESFAMAVDAADDLSKYIAEGK